MDDANANPTFRNLPAGLIARLSDGECTPDEAARLNQLLADHPHLRAALDSAVENHQTLREHIDRAMRSNCVSAPSSLASQIRSAWQAQGGESLADSDSAMDSVEPVGAAPSTSRFTLRGLWSTIFTEPHHANALAVAATILLIAGTVLFGIYGRTIDDVAPPSAADLVADAALFADEEHRSFAGSLAGNGDGAGLQNGASGKDIKITSISPAQAERYLSRQLGRAVHVFDLQESGYEFIGLSPCGMPVPAPSGHLVYKKILVNDAKRSPLLSVFIVPDQGGCRGKLCEGLNKGQWCCVSENGVKCKKRVLRGTDGELVYFLVCCVDGDLDSVTKQIKLAADDRSGR